MESWPPMMALMGCAWERKAQVWEGPQSVTRRHEAVRAPTVEEDTKGSTLHFSLPPPALLLHLCSSFSSTFLLLSSPSWGLTTRSQRHGCVRPTHTVVNNIQWDPSHKKYIYTVQRYLYKEREFTQWRGIMSEKSQLWAAMLRINGAMHYSAWGGRRGKRKDGMR